MTDVEMEPTKQEGKDVSKCHSWKQEQLEWQSAGEAAQAIWSQEWTHGAQLLNPLICGNRAAQSPQLWGQEDSITWQNSELGEAGPGVREDLRVEERKTGATQAALQLRWRAAALELCGAVE